MKAKRGDFAVCTKSGYVASNVGAGYSATSFTVGVVVSVTRDGIVKRVKPFTIGCDMVARDWNSIDLIPANRITDKAGFEAECRKRQSLDADCYDPWHDISDICTTARKFTA